MHHLIRVNQCQKVGGALKVQARNYHNLYHQFHGYKYAGHYNKKLIDPNVDKYSPLIIVPKVGYNKFSTGQKAKYSLIPRFLAAVVLAGVVTKLAYTDKREWAIYGPANDLYSLMLSPFTHGIAFVLNLNIEGEKLKVPKHLHLHRDADVPLVTNLDYYHADGTVRAVQPL